MLAGRECGDTVAMKDGGKRIAPTTTNDDDDG
jgi:hypothetical protein